LKVFSCLYCCFWWLCGCFCVDFRLFCRFHYSNTLTLK
jgi:hypothetical protein